LPFNVLNYALGLPRVRVRDYVPGSFVGMLPGTLLYSPGLRSWLERYMRWRR
jgi:uncharacterized membrane protein YdjX (TVP38/TMEM64 family)